MPRATTVTKLSLPRWAQIMGIHPLHFAQVTLPDNPPAVCEQPWLQHAWQDADRVGREDLARVIATAEENIETWIKARLAPRWEVDEWRPTIPPARPELVRITDLDARGFPQIVKARWRHFISGGVQKKTEIVADAAVSYADADGDSYKETATVTAAVSFTDPCEVHIFEPGEDGADAHEIRPISVSISGGTATITFRRELAVKRTLYEALSPDAIDGTDDDSFYGMVDVYRIENDPSQQATLVWENLCQSCSSVPGSTCAQCEFASQTACLRARGDPRFGHLAYLPAEWSSDDSEFHARAPAIGRAPEVVRLYYLAGIQDTQASCPQRKMPDRWERAVAYYAASLLDRPLCECNNIRAIIERWRFDMAIRGEHGFQVSKMMLDNPFGTMRGEVYAWQRVRDTRDQVGGAVQQ